MKLNSSRPLLTLVFLALVAVVAACIPVFVKGQSEPAALPVVETLRLLNTQELSYRHEIGRYASKEEMISYLQKRSLLQSSPIDLSHSKEFAVVLTTSSDATHYQLTIKHADLADQNAACRPAGFSDEVGVIYLGTALGCDDKP